MCAHFILNQGVPWWCGDARACLLAILDCLILFCKTSATLLHLVLLKECNTFGNGSNPKRLNVINLGSIIHDLFNIKGKVQLRLNYSVLQERRHNHEWHVHNPHESYYACIKTSKVGIK